MIIISKKKFIAICAVSVLIVLGLIFLMVLLIKNGNKELKYGELIKRNKEEIIVCGQYYNIDHPVVLWTDEGGYDAYRVELRFAPFNQSSFNISSHNNPEISSPNRYGMRDSPLRVNDPGAQPLTPEQLDQVRGGGWDLDLLKETVDQFVIHYDQTGTSKNCYNVLHDLRCLSVQFMLDLDGTIYQTLDVKERAWHAGIANTRSIGIEIANIGAYPVNGTNPFKNWYKTEDGKIELIIPENSGILTPNFKGGPLTQHIVSGIIQGELLEQYDLTPMQYDGLAKLVAVIVKLFPKIKLQFPTDENGNFINYALNSTQYLNFSGILGHFHVTTSKIDPGPAFQWGKLLNDIKKLLGQKN